MRQLEKVLEIPVGQLSRELLNLEKICLLTTSKEGNQKRYTLNQEFPFYDELKSIFLKTTGIGDVIRESLSGLKGIELVILYGSFAKGEAHSGSDIDLMVIGDSPDSEITKRISKVETILRRNVNYSLYERNEVIARMKRKDNFILTVFKESPILILGN